MTDAALTCRIDSFDPTAGVLFLRAEETRKPVRLAVEVLQRDHPGSVAVSSVMKVSVIEESSEYVVQRVDAVAGVTPMMKGTATGKRLVCTLVELPEAESFGALKTADGQIVLAGSSVFADHGFVSLQSGQVYDLIAKMSRQGLRAVQINRQVQPTA